MTNAWYDTAQICQGGHVINPASVGSPAHNQRFCHMCGKAAITACPACTAPIRGVFHDGGSARPAEYTRPSYCHNCGKAYPWTR